MDNGNITGISLGSKLDINSHDMLVPVSQPLFTFNRQKYQGSLLQTSVRYEADGWFAGWWGHTFEVVSTAENSVTPPLEDNALLSVITRTDQNNMTVYIIKHKDIGLSYTFNPQLFQNWVYGSGTITRNGGVSSPDVISILDGKTNRDSAFTVTIEPYTGRLLTFEDVDGNNLMASCYKDGENIRLEVMRDEALATTDFITLRVNNEPELAGSTLSTYTYDVSTDLNIWNSLFSLEVTDATTFALLSLSSSFEVVLDSVVLTDYNTASEVVTAKIRDLTVDELVYSFKYKSYWVQDSFVTMRPLTESMSQQVSALENSMFGDLISQGNVELCYNNSCVYRLGLPIWLQHRLEFNYSIIFQATPKPVVYANFIWNINTYNDDGAETPTAIEIAGFMALLAAPRLSIYSYITAASSPFNAVTRGVGPGAYKVVQPNNPRYSMLTIDIANQLRNNNLFIPTSFQPYGMNTNASYDPRPVVAGSDALQTYGLSSTGSKAKVWERNPDKYETAANALTIADMAAIPDGRLITPFVPEYIYGYGTVGVDLVANPFGYQPNPTLANYDPRQYVHAISGVVDPAVLRWTAGQAAVVNSAYDGNWGTSTTPNYTRYWLRVPQLWQIDWDASIDVGEYWGLYWPDLPVPSWPTPAVIRNNPYAETSVSGVIPVYVDITTTPDTTLPENQPASANGEAAPPQGAPSVATLTLGSFTKKSVLHAMKTISDDVNWEWAFKLTRQTKYSIRSSLSGRVISSSKTEYFNSNGNTTSRDAELVWKPITENFVGMTIYDSDPAGSDLARGNIYTARNDTWVLYLRCKNRYAGFPIPIDGCDIPGDARASYFTLSLKSNGKFREEQVLMNLFESAQFDIPSYTAAPNYDNYKVLNNLNLNGNMLKLDPGIFQGTLSKGIINVPLCVPGYAVSEVTTPDILASNLSAFALENNIENADLDPPTNMWRIDDTTDGYSLNLIKAELMSVQADSNTLYISYAATGSGPFYQLTKQPYTTDYSTGDITGVQEYSYPDWIKRNLSVNPAGIGSYTENDYCKVYVPGTQNANVIANLSVLLTHLDFIDSIDTEQQFTRNAYNSSLFDDIAQSYVVSAPAIVVSGSGQTYLETHNQDLTLFVDAIKDDKMTVVYDPDTTNIVGVPVATFNYWQYVGYTTTSDNKDKVVNTFIIKLKSPAEYDLSFKRTLILECSGIMAPVSIVKQADYKVTLSPEGYGVIDLTTNKLMDGAVIKYRQTDTISDDVIKIYVSMNNNALVYFKPVGFVARNNISLIYKSYSGSYDVAFQYDDADYVLHLDTRSGIEQYMSYKCTDIRTGEIMEVYRRDLNDVMLFVKQFWSNTVDTENFWWVDATHVLRLEKHTLTLYSKVGIVEGKQSVHDWNGDNWEAQEVGNRPTLISTDDLYYSVSSAHNTTGLLFKFRKLGADKIQLLYIDPLTMDWDNPVWSTIDIAVKQLPLLKKDAVALEHNNISSYGPLNINALITTTKISSTTVQTTGDNSKRILLIGIKQNNGLGQWCLKIDVAAKSLMGVIIGYGCVGPKGELTGGQIPIDYCGALGFNGTVYHLDALPETVPTINTVPTMIVGTASQQWFIQRTMLGIVSHLTFDVSSGAHVVVPLYLNNNVDMLMHYATYRGSRIQDPVPQNLNIATMFGMDNVALNLLIGIVSPSFFYFNIYYAIVVGIVASMGTYAYTWRNSSETQVRGTESLTDQDISFGKFEWNSERTINNKSLHVWAQIIIHTIQSIPETVAQVVVNKSQGQSTPDDSVGRKFSQLFTDIVSSTLSTAIDSSGFNVRVQSIVKHLHSLTSFYSINDKSECHAGPGFVNHNLKAQCTAQSMQDIQIDGKQLGYFSVLTALTALTLGAQNAALEAAYDALQRGHDSAAIQDTQISPGATINWGYAVALAISAGMLVTGGLIKLNNLILENLDKIVEAFGGKPNAFMNNWLSAHTPTLEGLHTYGNKSMSFFWPAFGVDTPLTYTNEGVQATLETTEIQMSLAGATGTFIPIADSPGSSDPSLWVYPFETSVFASRTSRPETVIVPVIKCFGVTIPPADAIDDKDVLTRAPEHMAVIEGTTEFLNKTAFKNEQIGVKPPVFGPPMIHDFMIDDQWALGYTAGAGAVISVSCDDTKLIDGPPSNVIITDDFCGIASSYIALEIKKTFDETYLRPTLVTANAIGLNINRINCVHDAKAYHAFDGQVNRIVSWTGGTGMDKELLYQQYLFQMNDHFKRSNIFPPAQFFGSFQGPPVVAIRSYEIVSNTIVEQTSGLGFGTNTPGENRNLQRFSTCVFSELLSSLPTTIRTLAPYKLRVNDGVTCLVTELRNTNTRYKAPTSVDFNIGTRLYRKTEEYIVEITEQSGVVMTETRTPSAGLEFIGPTMTAAYFYSPATKLYYEYAGGTELQKQDILNRFRDVKEGRWDFINQEVIFSVEHGYTGEVMILRLDQDVMGEVWPPNKTIYSDTSGFKIYSCAGGLVYQGPKRFIVSRFVTLEHMIPDIKRNERRWKKVEREKFVYERDYGWEYKDWYTETPVDAVYGWTHNPFLVETAMLGVSEDADNKFEWALTFAWSDTMEHIFEQNEYVTVNIMAETVTQGGVVRQRPTHLFLYKELFTRSDNAGYYTIKFQSNNGTGNRERLFIWSDGIIAMEDIKIDVKRISATRTQPLVTQVDLERLTEL